MGIDWRQYQIEQEQQRLEAARMARIHYAAAQAEEERKRKRHEAEEARKKAANIEQQRLIEQERQRQQQELYEKERKSKLSPPEPKTIQEQQEEIKRQVAASPIKLQVAYQRQGLEGYNKAAEEWNKKVLEKRLQNKLALETMRHYKKGEQYNVSQFIQDKPEPNSIKALENVGFDKGTIKKAKDYVYGLRKAETAFNNKKRDTQVFIVGQALGFKARQRAAKSENILASLNKQEKQAVLEEYIKSDISPRELRHKSLELLKQEWIEAAPIYALAFAGATGAVGGRIVGTIGKVAEISALSGLGGYTIYETVKNWDEMNNAQRAMTIAIATLLEIPLARATYGILKAKADPMGTKTSEIIKQANRPQDKLMTEIVKKQFGPETYSKLIKLNKAQNEYLAETVKFMKGKPNNKNLVGIKLEKAAREYTESIKGKIKTDEPLGEIGVRRQIEDMPKDIRSNIESIAEGLLPKKQQIKVAKQQYLKATRELNQARQKYPTKPDKWADLVLEQAVKENRYKGLLGRQSTNYQAELIRLRARLKELEGLKPKKKTERIRIIKEKGRVESKIKKIQEKYDKSLKSLEIEYGRGGVLTGKGRTIVLTPRKTRGALRTELRRQKMEFKVLPGSGGGAISAKQQDIAKIERVKDLTIKSPLNESDIKTQIQGLPIQKQLTQTDLANITRAINQGMINARASYITRAALQEQIIQQLKPLQKTMPEVKELVKVKTLTKTKVKEKLRTRVKPSVLIRIPAESRDKKKRQEIKVSAGAITYRRGELNDQSVWHTYHVDKEGGLNKSVVVGPPPEGAKVVIGKGSTTTTLKRIRGKRLPNFSVLSDTGAVDDLITSQGGKLTLTHVPDRISGGGMKRLSNGAGRLSPKIPKLR